MKVTWFGGLKVQRETPPDPEIIRGVTMNGKPMEPNKLVEIGGRLYRSDAHGNLIAYPASNRAQRRSR